MIDFNPNTNDLQGGYIQWLATPEDYREPSTEAELAKQLGVNRTTLSTAGGKIPTFA